MKHRPPRYCQEACSHWYDLPKDEVDLTGNSSKAKQISPLLVDLWGLGFLGGIDFHGMMSWMGREGDSLQYTLPPQNSDHNEVKPRGAFGMVQNYIDSKPS